MTKDNLSQIAMYNIRKAKPTFDKTALLVIDMQKYFLFHSFLHKTDPKITGSLFAFPLNRNPDCAKFAVLWYTPYRQLNVPAQFV